MNFLTAFASIKYTNIIMDKVEIMAPVGSFEALAAAIKAGADSVYFGVEQLNMRARASNNFTIADLKKISDICKKKKGKNLHYIEYNNVRS